MGTDFSRKGTSETLLEKERNKLEKLLIDKQFDLKDKEIIKASQHMDQIVIYYYLDRKKRFFKMPCI